MIDNTINCSVLGIGYLNTMPMYVSFHQCPQVLNHPSLLIGTSVLQANSQVLLS